MREDKWNGEVWGVYRDVLKTFLFLFSDGREEDLGSDWVLQEFCADGTFQPGTCMQGGLV